MLFSIAAILISGLLSGWLCKRLKLPALFGMILAGINFDSLGVTIPWGNQPYINFGSFIQSVVSFLLPLLRSF